MAALESSKNQASSILFRRGYVWNRKTARGDLESTWARGIYFLGEIGRFGRRACEGGSRLLHTDGEESRERARALDSRLVAMSELHRRSPHVLLCIFQLGPSLVVGEGI